MIVAQTIPSSDRQYLWYVQIKAFYEVRAGRAGAWSLLWARKRHRLSTPRGVLP